MGLCCNLCGWFSVIGSGLYVILGTMVANRNKAVMEHKFKLPAFTEGEYSKYDETIAKTQTNMFIMAIVLASLGVACLMTGVCLAKKEAANEQNERDQAAKQYAEIFREE